MSELDELKELHRLEVRDPYGDATPRDSQGRIAPEVFELPVEKMKAGWYSDAYFNFTKELLEAQGHCPRVTMQVFQKEHSVLGGIDAALWDIKGKATNLPVYQLLGGAWRTELPFYASIGNNAWRTPDEVCQAIADWLPQKPGLIKIRLDADRTRRDQDIPADIARFPPGSHPGVVVIRVPELRPSLVRAALTGLLARHSLDQLAGCTVVAQLGAVRIRRPVE